MKSRLTTQILILFLGFSNKNVFPFLKWIGEKQKEFNLSPMQLLAYQAPLSALLLATVIPIFDPIYSDNGILDPDNSMMLWVCLQFLITQSPFQASVFPFLLQNRLRNFRKCLFLAVFKRFSKHINKLQNIEYS